MRVLLIGVAAFVFSSCSSDTSPAPDAGSGIDARRLEPVPASREHAMVYDEARGKMLAFGVPYFGTETWAWDGATWEEHDVSERPDRRIDSAMIYDSGREKVILFGGNRDLAATDFRDTWEWDGTRWIDVTPALSAESPSSQFGHVMAYDSARERTVLLSGYGGGRPRTTWEFDGSIWTNAPTTNSPPLQRSSMVYDSARDETVVFLQNEEIAAPGETWIYRAGDWTHSDVSVAPGFSAFSMVYDAQATRAVLFGYPSLEATGEVWQWDGASWEEVEIPGPAPTARSGFAMAYDSERSLVMLHGGSSGSAETWALDLVGKTWTLE